MAEQTARTILNDLIETCRDGARGFQNAADLVRDASLKTLLVELAAGRQELARELEPHAQRLGGEAASAGTAAASVHRRWMEIKSALTSHDDYAIMREVKRGDAVTLRLFADAVAGILPPSVRDVVEQLEARVRADHKRIEAAMAAERVQVLL